MDAWRVKKNNMDILMNIFSTFMVMVMGMGTLFMMAILA